jgi:eukaryotic-like serine/threonine-protein kinase
MDWHAAQYSTGQMASPSASEIGVGTVVAETYEITNLLGQGGMGAVWAARHRRLPGKRVAIKVLHGGQAIDQEAFARFRREAEIASRIGHPNIVEVLDFNVLPTGTPYLVLEYLEGESLAQRIKRGPIPIEQALEIVRQVGSALHAAHREQVVHRDLKPDNIFLCPTDSGGVIGDRAKVLDFGISKIRGSTTVQTQESALLGTPQYMSPEQAFGKNKSIDQRTDVFALGAIVYEMLTGQPAFGGETLAEVVLAIVHQPAPTLSGRAKTPKHVVAAVDRALKKEPGDRFPDVATFIGDLTGKPLHTLDRRSGNLGLADTAAGLPTPLGATAPRGELEPAPPPTRVSSPGKRAGLAAIVLGGLAVAAAVAFGIVRRQGGSANPPVTIPVTGTQPPAINPPQTGTLPTVGTPNTTQNNPQTAPQNIPQNNPQTGIQNNPQTGAPANPQNAPPTAMPANPQNVPPTATPANPQNVPTTGTPVNPQIGAAANPKNNPPEPDKHVTGTPKKHADAALPPEVAAELDEAERALAGGKTSEAVRMARHSFLTQSSARGYSIITRAFCAERDLGNSKANFPHVGGDRARVARACKQAGIDLP